MLLNSVSIFNGDTEVSQSIKSDLNVDQPDVRDQSPAVHHPDISPGKRLLTALWRSPDRSHQIGTLDRNNNEFKNNPVKDVADAVARALRLSTSGLEVYFACAEYVTPNSRVTANAAGAYGFWMDVDCGVDKAEAGKGYATVKDAEDALQIFCQDTGLPKPTHVVHSGGGMHGHWVLDGAVARDEWQLHARQLKHLTKACGFLADDSRTADIASVLRVPGTFNHKYSPPRPVSLLHASAEFIDTSVMLDAIAAAHEKLCNASSPKKLRAPSVVVTAASAHASGSPDLARLASALATLDPDCDEETWKLRRLAPLALAAHDHPEDSIALYELARSWSSGQLGSKASRSWVTPGGNRRTGEEVFDEVWDRFLKATYNGTPTTLGTIFHDAIQAGWDPEESFRVIDEAGDA